MCNIIGTLHNTHVILHNTHGTLHTIIGTLHNMLAIHMGDLTSNVGHCTNQSLTHDIDTSPKLSLYGMKEPVLTHFKHLAETDNETTKTNKTISCICRNIRFTNIRWWCCLCLLSGHNLLQGSSNQAPLDDPMCLC